MKALIKVSSLLILTLFLSSTTFAEGFYIGPSMGYGGISAQKETGTDGMDLFSVNKISGYQPPSGLIAAIRFGYNIRDLICMEFEFLAQGWHLSGNGKKGGTGLTGIVLKYSPMWHFKKTKPYAGFAFLRLPVGYTVVGEDDGYAYRGLYWGIGIEGNYPITSLLSVGVSIDYRSASFKERIVNWNDDIKVSISSLSSGRFDRIPKARHLSFLIHFDFHFIPAK